MGLYTSSLNKIGTIHPKMYIVLVTRFKPKFLKIDGHLKGHVAWYPTLSPNAELLKRYKQDNDWESYTRDFYNQYDATLEMRILLQKLIIGSEHQDICMICYCTDFFHCHTSLLTEIGKNEFGCDIIRI